MRRNKIPMLLVMTLTVVLAFVGFALVIGVLMFAAYWPINELEQKKEITTKVKITEVSSTTKLFK